MRFFRKIAGLLGFAKEEPHEEGEDSTTTDHHHHHHHLPADVEATRKGFSVQVPVAVDRHHLAPLIIHSQSRDGGVQGLRWYAKRLRIDEDGDVGDEFLDEVLPEAVEMHSNMDDQILKPKFEVKYRAWPAKVNKQRISVGGKFQQGVEYQGKLQWV